ncbi:uncharacterized protein [Nicotiana sylvestris]|uniref:uncharacterized protein n=1 Tax=Nicotiana sylvestris TaxID=4096 RepID=UPI00388CB0A5
MHGDEDLLACNDTIVPFIEAEYDKGPWVYQTFETVSVEKILEGKCIRGPKLSSASVMVTDEMLKNGFMSGNGLSSSLQGIMHPVRPSGNPGTFCLGFTPTEKDVKRVKNVKQKVWSLPKPVPHISKSFVKPRAEKPPTSSILKPVVDVDEELIKRFQSLFEEVNMVEVGEGSSISDVQLIEPNVKLGNWEVTPLPTRKEFCSFFAGCSDMICMKNFHPSLKSQSNSEITIQEVEYDDEIEYDEEVAFEEIKYDEEVAFEEISKELKQFEEKPKTNLSETELINLEDQDDVRETKISVHLEPQVKEEIIKILFEYKDDFAWSYDDMPGLSTDLNAGETYMRAMATIFHEMIHREIEVYVDDVIIKSKKQSDHVKDLRNFFQRLRRYNLKLNPAKCAFGVLSGKLLGFVVSRCGIELDPSKIKAIQELPPPKNKIEVMSLLGRIHNEIADALATLASMLHHPDKVFVDPVHIQVYDQHAYCNVVEEEINGEPWFHDIKEYIKSGIYPVHASGDQKRTIQRLASGFFLSGGILYKRTPDLGLLRCIDAKEASTIMAEVHSGFKIMLRNPTPYRPKANGAVEAANKNIKKILHKMVQGYRTVVRTSVGTTPYLLVYGTEVVIPTEVEIPSLRIVAEAEINDDEWVKTRLEQLSLIDEKKLVANENSMQQVSVRDSDHLEVLWSISNQKVKKFLAGSKQLIRMKHGSGRSRRSAMMPQINHHVFQLTRFYLSETGARKFFNPQGPSHEEGMVQGQEILLRILQDESMAQELRTGTSTALHSALHIEPSIKKNKRGFSFGGREFLEFIEGQIRVFGGNFLLKKEKLREGAIYLGLDRDGGENTKNKISASDLFNKKWSLAEVRQLLERYLFVVPTAAVSLVRFLFTSLLPILVNGH